MMGFHLSDKIWLFNINIDLVTIIFLTIINAVLFFLFIDNYSLIKKSSSGFFTWSAVLTTVLLMLLCSITIVNFGFSHDVRTSTLQNMPNMEKQLAKSAIERMHQPLNLFQWNSVARDYAAMTQRIQQKETDKNKMRDPEVVKQLKVL